MPRISAFDSWLVKQRHASKTVAPSYDAVSARERQEFAKENPDNFLNTMRLMEDFAESERPDRKELLHRNRQVLERLLASESYEYHAEPSMFLYQLDTSTHVQTGVVCEVNVDEYDQGKIRKHENTLIDKESLLLDYLKVVGMSSSPICLAYPQSHDIDDLVAQLCSNPPQLDFKSFDDVQQRIWPIENPNPQNQLIDLFQNIEIAYLTDGHHRAASGSRYAKAVQAKAHRYDHTSNQKLLVVLFPDNQLNLLPFHRCVRDLNGKSAQQILRELEQNFAIARLHNDDFTASKHGEFGLFLKDKWYKLEIKHALEKFANPVDRLDASILQNFILDPVFAIKESRNDPRLGYVPDVSRRDGLQEKIAEGWPVLLIMHAASINQLMSVADAHELMPPKSTYFDPKPRSGIFVRRRGLSSFPSQP